LNSLSPYSIAIIEIFFSYNGWNTLNYSLDEFRNPEKKLKLSNIYSIVIVSLLCKFYEKKKNLQNYFCF
jgi:amino acid transporter